LPGLIPPSVAQAPKPSWIKPPAHWLISPEEKIISRQEDKSPDKEGIYEDLKQFFNSAPASSVVSSSRVVYIFFSYLSLCKIPFFFSLLGMNGTWVALLYVPLCMCCSIYILNCTSCKLDVRSCPDFYSFGILESDMGHGYGHPFKRVADVRF
jgi:hypothetical protein